MQYMGEGLDGPREWTADAKSEKWYRKLVDIPTVSHEYLPIRA